MCAVNARCTLHVAGEGAYFVDRQPEEAASTRVERRRCREE